ncbi:hypothetical protein C8N46_108125 [Kordia periserrulae]|uniref:Uncharacterized protein n=1 Tax=Kordia periserrulae TaxID=701523 RepID=A0A2T6BUT4_9FLAO|nr:hypothetical protein [Kordia periserrulae]PTX59812.1 hypothetical protein C8N46_108125 [Kordia periserrulae]
MTTNNLKTEFATSELFTTWELSMLIIGIGCLGILIFLSIVIYNYIHRFDWDDELHK